MSVYMTICNKITTNKYLFIIVALLSFITIGLLLKLLVFILFDEVYCEIIYSIQYKHSCNKESYNPLHIFGAMIQTLVWYCLINGLYIVLFMIPIMECLPFLFKTIGYQGYVKPNQLHCRVELKHRLANEDNMIIGTNGKNFVYEQFSKIQQNHEKDFEWKAQYGFDEYGNRSFLYPIAYIINGGIEYVVEKGHEYIEMDENKNVHIKKLPVNYYNIRAINQGISYETLYSICASIIIGILFCINWIYIPFDKITGGLVLGTIYYALIPLVCVMVIDKIMMDIPNDNPEST